MSYQEELENKKNNSKCNECFTFYGSEAYDGLCSACYKAHKYQKKEQKIQCPPSQASTPLSSAEKELQLAMEQLILEPTRKQQKDRKRCFDCNRKVGLLGIDCKCGFVFCNTHRLPQSHKCEFNHGEKAREKLKSQIVKISSCKIAQI